MEALCVLRESDLGLFENISTHYDFISIKGFENILIEDFNFESNNTEDFLEYLDFQEINQFNILVTNKCDRIIKFLDYLSSKCDIRFNVYDRNKNCLYGEENQIPMELIELFISQDELESPTNAIDSMRLIENSLYSLYTGIYPRIYREDIIKHIYLENGKLFDSINNSVIDKMSINGAFYVEKNMLNNLPQHMIQIDMQPYIEKKNLYIEMSEEEFNNKLETFSSLGVITNTFHARGIYDFSLRSNSINLNRLLVFESGIYLDFGKSVLISKELELSIKGIQNQISSKKGNRNFKSEILHILFNFANSFSSEDVVFITPYSKFKLDNTKNEEGIRLIGIIDGERNLMYNLETSKLYEVNLLFLEFLEADLKNSLDTDIFKNRYTTDLYKETLKEYKEIKEYVDK